jgi:hypothetical protein
MKRIARHQVAGGHDRGWGSYEKLSERGEKLVDLLVTEEHSREFPLLTKRLNGAHFGIVILRPLNPSIQGSRLYHLRAIGWTWAMMVTFYLICRLKPKGDV